MRRLILIAVALSALVAVPAAAQAKVHYLDAYDRGKDSFSGPLKTERLTNKVPYRVTVRGTFSLFDRGAYKDPFCGTTEAKPFYPTRGRANGPVDGDAEFIFADLSTNCARRPSPITAATFQIKVSSKYTNPIPIGGVGETPRPTHSYTYAVVGKSKIARFRLFDEFTKDNYGRLRITITRARARDCANNGFVNFKYADEASCVKATQRKS